MHNSIAYFFQCKKKNELQLSISVYFSYMLACNVMYLLLSFSNVASLMECYSLPEFSRFLINIPSYGRFYF